MLPAFLLTLAHATLSNGLEVSVLSDDAYPVVATQVWYHVGAADEDPGSRGLAHLFEHLMFGATAHYAAGDYSRFVTVAGGDENASTSPDETVYVSAVPGTAWEGVLSREADRMRNLVLTEPGLENEKRIVTEELRLRTENDPMSRLLVAAQRALLRGHPYAFDPSGSKEDVARATLGSCRSFYDAHYWPNRAHVVVVGPVDPDAALARVEESFGAIARGGIEPRPIPPLLGWEYPSEIDLEEDIPPVEIALAGVVLPPADSSDAPALAVLRELLTESAVDPFREEVVHVERKALDAGVEWIELRRGGGIVFYAASLPYRRKTTAYRSIDRALASLGRLDWVTDASLEAAKRRLLVEELSARHFAEEVAERIGQDRWHRGVAYDPAGREARIAGVGRAELASVWRRYVGAGERIRVYVKPERVPALIRMFGWLYPLFS